MVSAVPVNKRLVVGLANVLELLLVEVLGEDIPDHLVAVLGDPGYPLFLVELVPTLVIIGQRNFREVGVKLFLEFIPDTFRSCHRILTAIKVTGRLLVAFVLVVIPVHPCLVPAPPFGYRYSSSHC